jgi:rare lipoprotein A
MAINTQKFLPPSKGSPLAKINAIKAPSSLAIKKTTIDTDKLMKPLKEESGSSSIQKTLSNIDSSLKLLLKEEQKKKSDKRKEKEKADFEKEEKKLEAPKEAKKFNLPTLSIPGASFLDRIKRFLFFTALGWLFTKFQDQLPKLVGVFKVIMQVYEVAENIFKFLLESFVNFIDRGYKAYDKVRELTKSIGGEKAQKDFDNLSTKLNEYINYALIGGMALTGAINAFSKEIKGKQGGKGGGTAAGVGAGPRTPGRTPTGYRLDRGRFAPKGFEQVATPGQTRVAQYDPLKKNIFQKARQASRIGTKKATQAVIGKQATKQLLRLAKGPLSRLPILGGLIEFGLSWALGDPVGKAAFRGIGTILLGAVGSLILPGFGTFVGGWAGAELAGKLYEVLFENKQPKGGVQKKQGGGSVTRGGKPQGGPSRTIKIARRKPQKIKPKQSQPGKDAGGVKKIKTLYPDPSAKTEIEGEQKSPWFDLLPPLPKNATPKQIQDRDKKLKKLPNPYKALTGVAKKLKDIPFGIGALMGGAVDIALGEKLQSNAIQNLSSGISYLIGAIANQQISSSIKDIEREITKMQTGGSVPRSGIEDLKKRDDVELGRDINKVLSGLIQNKVDEAIREVQKQLMPAKYSGGVGSGGDSGGGGGGGGTGPYGAPGRLGPGGPITTVPGIVDQQGRPVKFAKPAADAFILMMDAAKKEKKPFRGSDIASTYRDPELNERVGGAENSPHLYGLAADIHGTTGAWIRSKGRDYGWVPFDYEGTHGGHYEYVGGGKKEKATKTLPDVFTPPSKPDQKPGQLPDIFQQKPKQELPPVFQLPGQKPQQPKPTGKVYKGTASWYGRKDGFHGRPTSSGEIFNTDKLTAAIQWDLRGQFGGVSGSSQLYYAKVTNVDNGKSVTVKINDVGPLSSGGVIDLSEAAFKKIASGGLGQGRLYNVSVQKMGPAPRENSKVASSQNQGKDQIAQSRLVNDFSKVTPYFSTAGGRSSIRPSALLGMEKATQDSFKDYQNLNDENFSTMQGGGYIPKQSPKNKTSSIMNYPSYSSEGGMMIAIQPVIVEKPIPISHSRKGQSITFISDGGGVNNTMQGLSRG